MRCCDSMCDSSWLLLFVSVCLFFISKVLQMKVSIKENIQDCNELNLQADNIYNCSRQVCANARNQPFKYICKYFKISCNEDSLAFHEDLVNRFSAIEQGKKSYIAEREALIKSVHTEVPTLIMLFSMNRLYRELGIRPFDIEDKYYPSYRFLYVSSGGNSSLECTVDFDVPTLEKFVHYIASVIEKKNSMVCQRQLMTNNLREQIKRRDGYKCVCCGASLEDEPHLLLEIDRIIPVFKGGQNVARESTNFMLALQ